MFPKHLLIMKAKKANVYHLKSLLRLDHYELKAISNQDPSGSMPCSFRLSHIEFGIRYDFGASSERERAAWMGALQGLCSQPCYSSKQEFWHRRKRTISSGGTEVSSESTDVEDDSAAGSTLGSNGIGMQRTPSSVSLASVNNSDGSSPQPPASPATSSFDAVAPTHPIFASTTREINNPRRFWRSSSLHLNETQQNTIFNRQTSMDLKLSDVITTFAVSDSMNGVTVNSNSSTASAASHSASPIPRTGSFSSRNEVKSMPEMRHYEDMPHLVPIVPLRTSTADVSVTTKPSAVPETSLASVVTSATSAMASTLDTLLVADRPIPPPKPQRLRTRMSTLSLVSSPQPMRDIRDVAGALSSGFSKSPTDQYSVRHDTPVSSARFSFLRTLSFTSTFSEYGDSASYYDMESSNSSGSNTLSRLRRFLKPNNSRNNNNTWKEV